MNQKIVLIMAGGVLGMAWSGLSGIAAELETGGPAAAPPWRIQELARWPGLQLKDSWRDRLCLFPEEFELVGVSEQGGATTVTWSRRPDGSYDFKSNERCGFFTIWTFRQYDKYGDAVTEFRSDQEPPFDFGAKPRYLLIWLLLRQPVQADRNLKAAGRVFTRFVVVDGKDREQGRFIGLYQVSARLKILIFEGAPATVSTLRLRDGNAHEEPLVSELVPFPYRALRLDNAQVRKIERLLQPSLDRVRTLRDRSAGTAAADQKKLRTEAQQRLAQTERQIEKLLTALQREQLASLQHDPMLMPPPRAPIPPLKIMEPDQFPWQITALERVDHLAADGPRTSVFGTLGTVVQFYDSSHQQQSLVEIGGQTTTRHVILPKTKQPRYLVVTLHSDRRLPLESEAEAERKTILNYYTGFLIRDRQGNPVGSFRVVAYHEAKPHITATTTDERYLDLVFEGEWSKTVNLVLSDPAGRACELKK